MLVVEVQPLLAVAFTGEKSVVSYELLFWLIWPSVPQTWSPRAKDAEVQAKGLDKMDDHLELRQLKAADIDKGLGSRRDLLCLPALYSCDPGTWFAQGS